MRSFLVQSKSHSLHFLHWPTERNCLDYSTSKGDQKWSGKELTLRPTPPLRTGHESFQLIRLKPLRGFASGRSRCHDGFLRAGGRWMPNFLKILRSSK